MLRKYTDRPPFRVALPMLGPFPCPARPFSKPPFTLPAIPLLPVAEMVKGEDAETLGGRIARLRREKGLTQIELAERLRVSQPPRPVEEIPPAFR